MNIALVADWLPTFAGAEHVIAEFHNIWPTAPIYTTIANHGHLQVLDNADIRTSALQVPYKILGTHRVLLPWMPKAIENTDLRTYDVVLSSSHAIGKGCMPPSHAVHICYCHTPMRYAWEMEDAYLEQAKVPKVLQSTLRKSLAKIRRWDLTSAKRVDTFIANSTTIQERIRRVYNRDSVVIHPPVDAKFFTDTSPKTGEAYFLAIGRLVSYKRFDLLVQAANALQFPLKIAGTGPELQRLQQQAGPTVEFLGFVPDENMPALYKNATALLFPQLEDAGVVPLEAQASGLPVLAYGQGGIRDTVQNGTTGIFFAEQTVASIAGAMKQFAETTFSQDVIQKHAKQFSAQEFRQKVTNLVHQSRLQFRQPVPPEHLPEIQGL